jgi:glycosyltransferase involved in cell wall biosynthesis
MFREEERSMAAQPVVLVLGPSLSAVSGVSTHVRLLLGSQLHHAYRLIHHQVGSEGRRETWAQRGVRLVAGPFSLAAAIARHHASIVHINWSLNHKSYWRDLGHLLAAKMCGARVVFQKHGGQLAEFTRNPGFRALVKASFRLADTIVVLSQAELREYRAFVPGKSVACVPNGVDPVSVIVAPRARGSATGGPLQVLYLGRLAAHKGIYETLDALHRLRARGRRIRFVVAGAGPEAARLRARAEALGLEADVRFAGPVHGEAKARLLCESDLLVLASYTEGLPYALLEGMAAGLVPVVTPVGAVPEVMSDGIHGRIVPMKDPRAIAEALAWLDENRTSLARMREACRRRVASAFTQDRLATEFNRVYAKLVPFVDATVRWRQV